MRSFNKVLIHFLGKIFKSKDIEMCFMRFGANRLTRKLRGVRSWKADGKEGNSITVEVTCIFLFKDYSLSQNHKMKKKDTKLFRQDLNQPTNQPTNETKKTHH